MLRNGWAQIAAVRTPPGSHNPAPIAGGGGCKTPRCTRTTTGVRPRGWGITMMIRPFAPQRTEEALHDGVVVAVASAAHARRQAMSGATVLGTPHRRTGPRDRYGARRPRAGDRCRTAIRNARQLSSAASESLVAPSSTIRREYRSSTAAKYNQPSPVAMYVRSAAQARFGPVCRKLAVQPVGSDRMPMPAVGRADDKPTPRPRANGRLTHQFSHHVLRAGHATGSQFLVDSRRPYTSRLA